MGVGARGQGSFWGGGSILEFGGGGYSGLGMYRSPLNCVLPKNKLYGT